MQLHTDVKAHMQVRLCVQLSHVQNQRFSFFVFLLYTSCREKLFIEGFFIEDYIQEI